MDNDTTTDEKVGVTAYSELRSITPAFVEFVPEVLERGVLYVSEKYGTASHLCNRSGMTAGR
jgi:hypothetical protein